MNSKWKLVFNPFERVAGWKAFGIGIVLLTAVTIIGYFGGVVFYALEIKFLPTVTWCMALSRQALGLAVTVAVMYLAALLFVKRVRFQDILGTVTLAKYPLMLVALSSLLLGKEMAAIEIYKILHNKLVFSDYVVLSAFTIISIITLVWEVALLYHAFRVSTNLKGAKYIILFTAIMLISEVATLVLINVTTL